MKRFVVFLVAVLAAAAMLAAFPATAGPKHGVPFKGSVDYTLIQVNPDGSFDFVGTGNVTHMGRVTATAHIVPIVFGVNYSITVVVTAANGDQVFLSGERVVTSPTTSVDTVRITGGTGRFTDATGEIVSVDVYSPDFSHDTSTWDGTIQY
jgi:hypothetical protein